MGARQSVDLKLADFSRHRESVSKILSRFEGKNTIKIRKIQENLFKLCIILKVLPFKCLGKQH